MGKTEDVLEEFSRSRINEEAVNIEKIHFYKTDKRVNSKQEDPCWVSLGKLPILVSAPHAVRHYRQKKIKMSDQFTGLIAYLLNRLTDCHAIATTKLNGGDPNVDNPCLYKERIAEICGSSVWYDKPTNSITMSGRHQDAVINFNYETGKLNWILGDPEGWGEEWQRKRRGILFPVYLQRRLLC